MPVRELDGQGRFIIRTRETHTVGGQKIKGQLLQCEPIGASNFCMHCGGDPTNSCKKLNKLAYGEDPAEIEARNKSFEARQSETLAPFIAAFGCDTEAKGGKACARWCGSENCTYAIHEDGPAAAGVQGDARGDPLAADFRRAWDGPRATSTTGVAEGGEAASALEDAKRLRCIAGQTSVGVVQAHWAPDLIRIAESMERAAAGVAPTAATPHWTAEMERRRDELAADLTIGVAAAPGVQGTSGGQTK